MPRTTVTTHTATGRKIALCSCSWEGTPMDNPSDAYREANRHKAEKHPDRAAPAGETASAPPKGETR